jgi:hypothetical protein
MSHDFSFLTEATSVAFFGFSKLKAKESADMRKTAHHSERKIPPQDSRAVFSIPDFSLPGVCEDRIGVISLENFRRFLTFR